MTERLISESQSIRDYGASGEFFGMEEHDNKAFESDVDDDETGIDKSGEVALSDKVYTTVYEWIYIDMIVFKFFEYQTLLIISLI